MIAALVPSLVLFARHGTAARKMRIPVRAVPRPRRDRRALRRRPAPRRVPRSDLMEFSPVSNEEEHPEALRLCRRPVRRLDGRLAGRLDATRRRSTEHSDLVAQLIGDSGLLAPDKLEAVRTRARGGSFSRALLDEGFAHSLGVARNLAEQYHLPLVDLAVEGVDAEASEDDPAAGARARLRDPVRLRRQSGCGSGSPSRRTCRGSTSSGSRRVTRPSSRSSPREDVLTELRRLGARVGGAERRADGRRGRDRRATRG